MSFALRVCLAGALFITAGCKGSGPYGLLTTFAGHRSGFEDGLGTAASFHDPEGITAGADGTLYVADTFNHRIRAIALDGRVSTIAGSGKSGHLGGGYRDGPGAQALFKFPRDVTADQHGHLYVADTSNNLVRVIDLDDAAHPVTTLAGVVTHPDFRDGPGRVARFGAPWGIAVGGRDRQHEDVYVSDTFNQRIRCIRLNDPAHTVSTVAGTGLFGRVGGGYRDGPGAQARFFQPRGLALDFDGTHALIYVADASNQVIRRIDLTQVLHPMVTTLGGTVSLARRDSDPSLLVYPTSLVLDRRDPQAVQLYALDSGTATVYRVGLDGVSSWLVGGRNGGDLDGFWRGGRFSHPESVVQGAGGRLYVTDCQSHRVRQVR